MSCQLRSKANFKPESTTENKQPPNKDIVPPLRFVPSATAPDIIFDKTLPGLNRTDLQTLDENLDLDLDLAGSNGDLLVESRSRSRSRSRPGQSEVDAIVIDD